MLVIPLFIVAIATPGSFSIYNLLIALALFLCIVIGEPTLLKFKSLQTIGTISYSFYLLQYLILAPIVEIAWTYGVREFPALWIFFIALSIPVLLVPLSVLSYRLIESPWLVKKLKKPPAIKNRELSMRQVNGHRPDIGAKGVVDVQTGGHRSR